MYGHTAGISMGWAYQLHVPSFKSSQNINQGSQNILSKPKFFSSCS
jgi:hypothetical protein